MATIPTRSYQEGKTTAKVLILGEAPAAIELNRNKPFCGPSGDLLTECLHSAGLTRTECQIQNVFTEKVLKRRNSPKLYLQNGDEVFTGKKFTEVGMLFVQELLDRISSSDFNVIVPLGQVATSVFLPNMSVFKIRGSLFPVQLFNKTIKVIPSMHPAYCLRGQLHWKHILTHDLQRARDEASFPEYHVPDRELVINPSFNEVLNYIDFVSKGSQFATDIEIYNRQVSCFSISPSPKSSICIPLLNERAAHRWTVDEELAIWRAYASIVGSPRLLKINQNLLFDLQILLQNNKIIPNPPYFCTMVAQILLHPDFPASLEFLTSIHTKEPYYKDDKKLWRTPDRDPIRFWEYNAKDSLTAVIIAEEQKTELEARGIDITHSFHMDLFHPLMEIMTAGIKTDQEKLAATKKNIETAIEELEHSLQDVADYEFNYNSPAQCKQYFYEHKKYYKYTNRKTGEISCDEMALSRIRARYQNKEAEIILKLRDLTKLRNTYLEMKFDTDGRLRSSMHPASRFGRLRSSKTIFGTGGNQQNFDPRFKEFLIPG